MRRYYSFDPELRVVIVQDEDGMFVATVPALPGVVSQGETDVEAFDNVREAARGYIASMEKDR